MERTNKLLREISIAYDQFGFADASVLFEQGHTKIQCSVTLLNGVPPFLRGKGTGWLTAEYAMLPCATTRRTQREATLSHRNSRSVEISRIIGRSLRSVVNLNVFGERTIHIDCDVLQADGGTRVASVTAASLALALAVKRWIKVGIIDQDIISDHVAGISVGMLEDKVVSDLNASKDMSAQADFNFILTGSGDIIEIQGTAERAPISWVEFEACRRIAIQSVEELFTRCHEFEYTVDNSQIIKRIHKRFARQIAPASRKLKNQKAPLFSLANR